MSIVCFANEAAVPPELGGPQDLNFDGDADDDLANQSNGTDLKLVPIILKMTFGASVAGDRQSLTVYRLVSKTTD